MNGKSHEEIMARHQAIHEEYKRKRQLEKTNDRLKLIIFILVIALFFWMVEGGAFKGCQATSGYIDGMTAADGP